MTRPMGLASMLAIIMGCSIADALLTLRGLWEGVLIEANPIWAGIISDEPVLFFVLKVAITAGSCGLLWLTAKSRPGLTMVASVVGVMVYVCVMGLHIIGSV